MCRYVIGVDFGTLSARAVLLNVDNGDILGEFTSEYAHGVMDEYLCTGKKLPDNFALQHPEDYIEALERSVKGVVSASGIDSTTVGAIGIDFTASTVLPIDENGTPLAFVDDFVDEPHAYVKLWKHHGAQKEADDLARVAVERGEEWLDSYGGTVSAEFMIPKILETARSAPEVYRRAYRFIEAGNWITMLLTGRETNASAFAGFKAFWDEEKGFPSNEYFCAVDPNLDGLIGMKIYDEISSVSCRAGTLCNKGSELTGLKEGIPVSLAMLDAHAAMPALNITDNGNLMLILGTSACHIINCDKQLSIDGIFGRVKNGVIPGLTTYEAGQQCFGDAFDWFVSECVPTHCIEEAQKEGKSIHQYLSEKAANLDIGRSGIVALDWFNGNRSVLVNSKLSGMLLGITIRTKPEEIYRALLEAASFGTRRIIDQFTSNGIEIKCITAAGGIANKNSLLMQIMADVTDREIKVCSTTQAAALGSAIYASVAGGFYSDVTEAAVKLSAPISKTYTPISSNVTKYQSLYKEYLELHDYFGRSNLVMERLSDMKQD